MNIQKQKIERITIIYSEEEKEKVSDYLDEQGYDTFKYSGPVIKNHKATDKYKIVYEKIVEG